MPEEKKENMMRKFRQNRTMDGKEDAGGMPFTVYRCVNVVTQADCKGPATNGRLMTGSLARVIRRWWRALVRQFGYEGRKKKTDG